MDLRHKTQVEREPVMLFKAGRGVISTIETWALPAVEQPHPRSSLPVHLGLSWEEAARAPRVGRQAQGERTGEVSPSLATAPQTKAGQTSPRRGVTLGWKGPEVPTAPRRSP